MKSGFLFSIVLALVSVSAAQTEPLVIFQDLREPAGIEFSSRRFASDSKYLLETMGGGIALLDYDNDGRLDIFFANGCPLPEGVAGERPKQGDAADRLYRNRGDGSFEDVTRRAGLEGRAYTMGAATADWDNDGDTDLYVTAFPRNFLYRNNGDGTFSETASRAGVAAGGWSAGAVFLDVDHDGFLDLYVTRYLNWGVTNNPHCGRPQPGYRSYCSPDRFEGVSDLLYRNRGDGTFEDISARAGIGRFAGKGLGVAAADFNRDGWIDLYVANDRVPCFLFLNKGDGTLEEVGLRAGVAYNSEGNVFGGMGVDFQDYDNDGWPDLFVTTLTGDTYVLFRNNGDQTFTDMRYSSGLAAETLAYTGWGTRFVDYDNDGWKDLFSANSHVMDNIGLYLGHVSYLQSPLLFRNLGDGRFGNVSAGSGPALQVASAGRGAAFGDLDNDGDLDVVVSNLDAPPNLLTNQGGNRRSWLQVELEGRKSNRSGQGALLKLTAGESSQYWTVTTAGSYLSASDPRAHFGLGEAGEVDLLEVWWPSGTYQRLEKVAANQKIQLVEPPGSPADEKPGTSLNRAGRR